MDTGVKRPPPPRPRYDIGNVSRYICLLDVVLYSIQSIMAGISEGSDRVGGVVILPSTA